MRKITVYSTDHCSFCMRAKALLDARELEYEEINLERDPDGRAELARRTGMLSFPQILVEDELVGGFMELAQADRSGRLRELIGEAAA
ncbi:MAG: glutaredoxin [Solirubrobacteraceae bacterium]|nr:glutaredoxin [Solirubrobacteraceae bacterium]